MGAELCLAHDMGGWRHWGPLSVDMQPYGCFILNQFHLVHFLQMIVKTFSGVMNRIATMPSSIQEADRPTSPQCPEGQLGTDINNVLPDGELLESEDMDAFKIEYDIWYPEEQVCFCAWMAIRLMFTLWK